MKLGILIHNLKSMVTSRKIIFSNYNFKLNEEVEICLARQTCADFRNAPEGRQTHQVMVLRRLLDRERSAAQRQRRQQGCIHSDDLPCE